MVGGSSSSNISLLRNAQQGLTRLDSTSDYAVLSSDCASCHRLPRRAALMAALNIVTVEGALNLKSVSSSWRDQSQRSPRSATRRSMS